jgi:N-carbamoyl-L-amino-acid hydrolase
MLASGAVAGRWDRDFAYGRTDRDGLSFGEELRRIGYQGREEDRPGPAYAYLELHVEQNPVLEMNDLPVGVVEGINTITWMNVTVEGESNNGPPPMEQRRDALQAAALMISALDRIVREHGDEAVGGVGRIQVEPNVINQVPARAVFSVDIRHPQLAVVDALAKRFTALADEIAAERGVAVSVERFWTSEPTHFNALVVDAVEAACQELDVPHMRLWSGSGHDAKYMADVCPTGMIFTRSRGGLSHREDEYSTPEDIEASVNVLLRAAVHLANDA